jgi:hypothetical protein
MLADVRFHLSRLLISFRPSTLWRNRDGTGRSRAAGRPVSSLKPVVAWWCSSGPTWTAAGVGDVDDRNDGPDQRDEDYLAHAHRFGACHQRGPE